MAVSYGTKGRIDWSAVFEKIKDISYRVESPVTQRFKMPLLGSLEKLVLIIAPIYLLVEFTTTDSYYSGVNTAAFFTSSISNGYLYVDDPLVIDGYFPFNYSELVTQDAEDWLFISTKLTYEIQQLIPSSVSLGYYEWETINTSTVYVPMENLTHLDINVIARIECNDIIFSNYDRNDLSTNKYHALNLGWVLSSAGVRTCGGISNSSSQYLDCCDTSCPYAGYAYNNGLDIAAVYAWYCDLTRYNENDRYLCAYDTLEVSSYKLSSTSIVERIAYYDLPSTDISDKLRKKVTTIGIKLRLRAIGGCVSPSLAGVTSVLAQGFGIYKMCTVLVALFIAYAVHQTGQDQSFIISKNDFNGEWETRPSESAGGLRWRKSQGKNVNNNDDKDNTSIGIEVGTSGVTRNVLNADGAGARS